MVFTNFGSDLLVVLYVSPSSCILDRVDCFQNASENFLQLNQRNEARGGLAVGTT